MREGASRRWDRRGVRVWIAVGDDPRRGRVTVEEVHSGRQGELRGEAAATLAARLERAVSPGTRGAAEAGGSRGVPQEGAVR